MINYNEQKYEEMKNFEKIYSEFGAYHINKKGFNGWWLEDNYRLISKFVDPEKIVLDLACGEGKLSEFLKNNQIIGIDNSPTSLELNKKYYPLRYEKLILGDMKNLDKLELSEHSIDVTVCSLSFMYLIPDDFKNCLENLKNILKQSGMLIFSYPNVSSKRAPNSTAAEISFNDLKNILISADFKNINRYNICPLLPKWAVKYSSKPIIGYLIKQYYNVKKIIAKSNSEEAYHYLVVCNL